YCRFQKMRGGFTEAEYEREIEFVKESLGALAEVSAAAIAAGAPGGTQGGDTHWQEYLAAWV
ncbi:MAG: 3-5 exonuclease, partial [Rhizobacter sp.]|nr:3-5 exonuclease [Rhizobacter sp.]